MDGDEDEEVSSGDASGGGGGGGGAAAATPSAAETNGTRRPPTATATTTPTLSQSRSTAAAAAAAYTSPAAKFRSWSGLAKLLATDHISAVLKYARSGDASCVKSTVVIFNMFLSRAKSSRNQMLNTLALQPSYTTTLWNFIKGEKANLALMMAGKLVDHTVLVAALRVFADTYSRILLVVDDQEFYERDGTVDYDVGGGGGGGGGGGAAASSGGSGGVGGGSGQRKQTLPLDELVDASSTLTDVAVALFMSDALVFQLSSEFDELRKSLCKLLHQLFVRDCQRQYTPDGHWIAQPVCALVSAGMGFLTDDDYKVADGEMGLAPGDGRSQVQRENLVKIVKILKALPFVVPFDDRAAIFQRLIASSRAAARDQMDPFGGHHPNLFFDIRRDHVYQDAFDSLNDLGQREMRSRVRVQYIDEHGMAEAGIDGGGLFREFLATVILEGFNPEAGFYKASPDQRIYPNSQAKRVTDSYLNHFEFMGRMLGKAIYDQMLMELPLARFFVSKLLGQRPSLNDLASLDPEMHKNLLFLKTYAGDVADLSLDFTVSAGDDSGMGGADAVVELIPGGRDTAVTNSNRIRYLYLVADYRLNIQIDKECDYFRRGFFSVIDKEWLVMFSPVEVQAIISGSEKPIDVDDLIANTNYGGEYHDQGANHPTILLFWDVVRTLSEDELRDLLKFVTSCRLAPLLGFSALYPKFCIGAAGNARAGLRDSAATWRRIPPR